MSDRPITPFAAFESDSPPELPSTLPPDPKLPTDVDFRAIETERAVDPESIAARVANLSDQLLLPEGIVHRLFKDSDRRSARRDRRIMKMLCRVLNNQVEGLDRISKLETSVDELKPKVETHEHTLAKLSLVHQNGNGNGADHG